MFVNKRLSQLANPDSRFCNWEKLNLKISNHENYAKHRNAYIN